jgi:hypothetical protein
MKISWQKNKVIAALVLIIIAGAAFGLFRMSLNKANEEIARFVQILDGLYLENETTEGSSPVSEESKPEDEETDQNIGSVNPIKPGKVSKPAPSKDTSPQLPELPHNDNETDDPDPSPPENKQKHALFGYMPVEDQSYLIAISNRFSLKEIRMIVDAYQSGGEEWEISKQLVIARVSEAEILRVRYLINEYML